MPRSDPAPHRAAETADPHAVRALIVDAHEATRLGFAMVLRRQPWIARCFLAADQNEAAALAARHRPEVALLDISEIGPFAGTSTERLRESHPGIAIVLTSRCSSTPPAPPRTLGAAAFLPAGAASSELVAAVRAAVLALDYEPPTPTNAAVALSDRERDLLALISQGATNREIATQLHLGPDAVKKNASALYRKLRVRNRTEAAQRAADILRADGPR
jgi:DNA-binding NarL/FixJ family response regulator